MGISIKITGLDAAIKNIKAKEKRINDEIDLALNAWALETELAAKQLAPTHEGLLKGSINADTQTRHKKSITVNAFYAAYIEFGTRKFAAAYISSLPPEWEQFAAQFKGGGGGSFAELVKNITEWVRLKGIDQKAAYPIALKILRDGIRPQPFLYPATQKTTPVLLKDIKDILK